MTGKKIQNYEIRAHLGEGGMGTVYRATDTVLGRDVALKMLHAPLLQQTQFLERFRKEARLLAQLLHPNIAVIYNLIEQDGNQYMVMEYIEGRNLDAMLRQHGALSYKWVVPAFMQALEGLQHAHKKGIYHRDIKPSNLIITPDGTVKLMDFGIAMMAGEKRMTQVNRVVGTIEYMAPELIEGKDPSVASDIYAVGITMYELLTGKLPFEGNTDFNLMQDILKKKPVAPDKMNASVPKALTQIVMKALEKKPEHRFANAREFSNALVNAFPELRSVDLSISSQPAPTRVYKAPATGSHQVKPTMVQGRTTVAAISGAVSRVKEKVLKKENRIYLLAALFVLAVSILLFALAGMNRQKPEILSANDLAKDSLLALNHADRGKTNPNEERNDRSGNGGGYITPVNNGYEPVEENREGKENEKEDRKEDKGKTPVKKEADKSKNQEDRKEDKKKEDKQDEIKEDKKNDPPPPPHDEEEKKREEKKREPKTIRITSAPEVSLYLREPLTENTRSGQTLYFNVMSAVRYNGEVIIERGAQATGRVKSSGSKKISIVISQVRAANGEMIPFQEVELSGRIADMISNRSYSVSLKRGTTIQL